MNDTEYLTWIAEHLVMFRPAFSSAYMEYVDDAGFSHSLTHTTPNNLGDNTTALLKECIDKANERL
jgi:hypothetical protein